MSIATLKKKTASQYNNVSVGQKQFSLNGTRRLQGFVGQTMLSRSLPRTPMRGTDARGSGGVEGTYPTPAIITCGNGLGVGKLNDTTVVKHSVLDTQGMIMSKYRWIRRPAPYISVKPDSNLHTQTQQQYIEQKDKLAIAATDSVQPKIIDVRAQCCANMKTNYTNFNMTANKHVISKPLPVVSQGEYVFKKFDIECGPQEYCTTKKLLQRSTQETPFSCHKVVSIDTTDGGILYSSMPTVIDIY